ncbi:class I SAM-dependent methyltransferase [Paracoccus suum]|uniref:Class I SAM-dependent methyltransferase n=1 Tax=Paracoccus suum TaxID=2259340 RepID=A0A344PKB3_9RHOB|nr:SAM-dependent methyltransferase [Paracoccus suum]AXC49818.1 class I SAM-dependent methyltransferase [Paracoccus suum]
MPTPLGRLIAARIAVDGPMRLDDFMQTCLLHPQHGYYATRDPFGARGDFTTAPEVSQMFGELVGLAIGQAWRDQGAPADAVLAEIGPGRGTLMADARRVLAAALGWQPPVILIEASPHLRGVQRDRLGAVTHLDDVAQLPEKPLFLIANEFFDALPIRQFQRVETAWAERVVTLSPSGDLTLALAPPVTLPRSAPVGEVFEDRPGAPAIMTVVAERIARHGGAAIIIDYGTFDGRGDSLQALRRHRMEGILDHPGEADLTSHVDFAPLAVAARAAGAAVSSPVPQGVWLESLGITARAERLAAAGPAAAHAVLTAHRRLTHPAEMGELFEAMAIWPEGVPPVPGFQPLVAGNPGAGSAALRPPR